mmetsp:Transcript_36250/g.58593  ORF Transcript_36250/g.58593 Transcript_36250/m.58593 type:complete len:101 (-) Transcript_36250:40-342(-)
MQQQYIVALLFFDALRFVRDRLLMNLLLSSPQSNEFARTSYMLLISGVSFRLLPSVYLQEFLIEQEAVDTFDEFASQLVYLPVFVLPVVFNKDDESSKLM